jgi:hypothetical protein
MDTVTGGASPRTLARIAGALYLVNIVAGAFAIGYVRATVHDIQNHELLYRFSLVAHLVVTLTNIPLAMIFYELFKVVNRRLALLDMCFTLVATAIEAAGIPLTMSLATIDYDIYTVFFGFDIICVGYLIFRSTFLPRAIGVLMAIDGLAYLVNGFADLLAPGFAAHLVPWIQLPAPLGEGSLCLWLLIVGLDAERWRSPADSGFASGSLPLGHQSLPEQPITSGS